MPNTIRKQTLAERLTDVQKVSIIGILLAGIFIFEVAAVILILNSLAPGVKSVGAFVLGIVCSVLSIASVITLSLIASIKSKPPQ